MADEQLDVQLGDQQVAGPVALPAAAPSVALTEEKVQALITEATERAAREGEERALRQSQSLVDKAEARIDRRWQDRVGKLLTPYEQALQEHGAEPGDVEALRTKTRGDLEVQELKSQVAQYRERDAQRESEYQKERSIRQMCEPLGMNPYDPRLQEARNAASPDEFLKQALVLWKEDQLGTAKATTEQQRRQVLEAQQAAGELDVTGGGAAMVPAAWSVSSLIPGSEESIISEHLMHYFKTLSEADMGQKILKVQQLMKSDPRLAGRLKETARRVWDMEQDY